MNISYRRNVVGGHDVTAALAHLVSACVDCDRGIGAQHELVAVLDDLRLVDFHGRNGRSRALVDTAANVACRDRRAVGPGVLRVLELAENHALMHELHERLASRDDTRVVEHLVPKTRIEKV
jgi:hypothetical protein